MEFRQHHPFLGREFDWIATDDFGYIGYFSTAGVAPVPDTCLSNGIRYDGLFENVTALPVVSQVTVIDESVRDIADWIAVAKRGLYAYDWSRRISRYCIVAYPDQPANVGSLPEELRTLAIAVKFPDGFAGSNDIAV
jgi:hypothetical protein